MDDLQGHEDDIARRIRLPIGHRLHIVEIFIAEARNDFRNARGAAGQLKDRDLIGVTLNSSDRIPRSVQFLHCDHTLHGRQIVWPLPARDNDVFQRRRLCANFPRESNVVELFFYPDDMRARPGMAGEIRDLLIAMSRERANGNQIRLPAGDNRRDKLLAVAQLKNNAIKGIEAQVDQGPGEPVRRLVQLPICCFAIRVGQRDIVRILPQ